MMKTAKMIKTSVKDVLPASQKGDTSAFRTLVETYQGYAFSLAVRFLGNDEDAYDIVQETFIRVWKHLPSFDFRCKFTTWMYRIVINLCLDRSKTRDRQNRLLDPAFLGDVPMNLTTPIDLEDESIKKELATIIAVLAGELPPRQQSVFILRDLQDQGVAEVSQILGISKSSVKTNLSHARRNIREKLRRLEKKTGGKNEM